MTIDDKTRIELEAAVFRRVVSHLRNGSHRLLPKLLGQLDVE